MRLKLLLNIENFQNVTHYTAEHSDIKDCYREQVIFLQDWVAYTPYAGKLLTHILKILGEIPVGEISVVPEGRVDIVKVKPVKDASLGKSLNNSIPADSNPFEYSNDILDYSKVYKINSIKCTKCNGTISWDLRDTGRKFPLHVDKDGKIFNGGECIAFKKVGGS